MRATAPTVPMPMPTLAPVSRPLPPLDCDVDVEDAADEDEDPVAEADEDVVAAVAVLDATVPAGLLVDVGLKSFTYVMEPPAEAGSVLSGLVSQASSSNRKSR